MSCTELTGGHEKVDVITSNKVLGHTNDRGSYTLLAVMVLCYSGHIVGELSDLNRGDTLACRF